MLYQLPGSENLAVSSATVWGSAGGRVADVVGGIVGSEDVVGDAVVAEEGADAVTGVLGSVVTVDVGSVTIDILFQQPDSRMTKTRNTAITFFKVHQPLHFVV